MESTSIVFWDFIFFSPAHVFFLKKYFFLIFEAMLQNIYEYDINRPTW